MDLSFTSEELQFRDHVRSTLAACYPAAIKEKMDEDQNLSKEDMVRWQQILLSLIHI